MMTIRERPNGCERGGFTLVELLVVISIITLLVSILMPALGKAREHAQRVYCAASLHSMGLVYIYYGEDGDGWLPWPRYSYNFPYTLHYAGRTDLNNGELIRFAGYWMVPYIESDGEIFFCPSAKHRLKKDDYWPNRWPTSQEEAVSKSMVTHYTHYMYLSRNVAWSRGMQNPERYSDPPGTLLASDLAATATSPQYDYLEMTNHRKRGYNTYDSSEEMMGMNALYLDGHVKWETYLPNVVSKGEVQYWLPEYLPPSVGRIRKPYRYRPDFN